MTDADSHIYRDLMRFKPDGWTANAWAVAAGVSRTVWTDMRRHGNPSRRTLEKLLAAAGSSIAEFEALRFEAKSKIPDRPDNFTLSDARPGAWQPSHLPALPLIASAAGGVWRHADPPIYLIEMRFSEVVDNLSRPPLLRNDGRAFALTVVTQGMWPRFRPGRRLAVSPQAQIAVGDDILVTLSVDQSTGRATALIGELVGQGPRHIELRQFSPDTVFQVPSGQFSAVHKIVGELI